MKKTKTGAYTDYGFGFAVTITNLPLELDEGEWVPAVDLRHFQRPLVEFLIKASWGLTGSQVRFLRQHLGLTLEQFAEFVGVTSHQSVMKWEKRKDESAGMDWANEKNLRLKTALHLGVRPQRFVELFVALEKKSDKTPGKIVLDASSILPSRHKAAAKRSPRITR